MDNQPVNEEDYRPSKNDRQHPAKYLHRESCLGKDTNGALCDCDYIPNPRYYQEGWYMGPFTS